MANTIGAFDFKIDIHGAQIIAAKNFIGNTCPSEADVDGIVAALKADLDAVAVRMKIAIKKQAAEPLGIK